MLHLHARTPDAPVEDCGGELRRKPAAVLEVELYSDEDIAECNQADAS